MKILILAIVCALAVPTAQLRMISTISTCCCPDPSHCHCPDHKPDHSGQPAMRACHRQSQDFVSPIAPVFIAPDQVALVRPARVISIVATPLPSPHASPAPRRPDAPS